MTNYNRGSSILIEISFRKKEPFGNFALFDPDQFNITIYQENKPPKINEQNLTRKSLGNYYYIILTDDTWSTSEYHVRIFAQAVDYTDIGDRVLFALV